MKTIIDILRAAGEDTRLRIIALLSHGELTAGELSSVLAQSQPRVSRHLKLLFEAGIIERRAEGSWVFVRLSYKEPAYSLIQNIIKSVNNEDFTLKRDLEKLHEIKQARQESAKAYFEKIAPEWESLRKLHQPEKAVEDAMLEMVKGQNFKLHLDLGSGMGSLLETFANISEKSEGIDTSRGMLNLARARFDEIGANNLSVRQGDILNLPYEPNTADFISIHQVLHYLDNPQAAINEAARVMKEGGVLLIADFAPHDFEELREKFGHLRLGFAEDEVKKWCEASGLKIEEIKSVKDENQKTGLIVNIYKAIKPKNMKIDNLTNRSFA